MLHKIADFDQPVKKSPTLADFPGVFQIVRNGNRFALLIKLATQYRTVRTRFRRHGANKYRYDLEPVAGTSWQRIEVDKDAARRIKEEADAAGRVNFESYSRYGSCQWSITVWPEVQA